MCGYFGNLHECPAVIDLLNRLHIKLPYPQGRHYQRRRIQGLISQGLNGPQLGDALWWYQLRLSEGKYVPDERITSFNARDLSKPLWRNAVKHRRGVLFATEIGESEGNNRYLMRAEEGLALGALFKDWTNSDGQVTRSLAIITRPPHLGFSRYHSKSMPLFLPLDPHFLQMWLDPNIATATEIETVLNHPQLRTQLAVTRVKTYKNAEVLGDTEILDPD